ncbi:MAG: MlaE family ABC transporter permease [Gemmatimonadota bacterium]
MTTRTEAPDGPVGERSLPGRWLRALGRFGLECGQHLGRAGILAAATALALRRPRRYVRASFAQARAIGIESLGLVMLVAALSGAILAQQTGYQFTTLPMWIVGDAVAAGMLTELAPLLTAIILAGRVGSGIGAELGTMKVTDQIDALRTLGRDPVVELVAPRVLAGAIVMVPLVALSNIVGIWAGWLTSISLLPITTHEYIYGVRQYYHAAALIFSLLKGFAFGITITFVSSYVGFQAEGGAAGVGRTATNAVVSIIVALMVLDMILAPLYKAVS